MELNHSEVCVLFGGFFILVCFFLAAAFSLFSFIIELTATTLDRKFLGKIVRTLKVAFLNYSTSGLRDFVFQHSQRSLFSTNSWRSG